jgi:hypothetical protein
MGDDAHKKQKSDHNDGNAFDLTHDPKNGVDCGILSRKVIQDSRVTYVIWNREIYFRAEAKAGWAKYDGKNPHTHHMHVSIAAASRDDLSPWPWTPESAAVLNQQYSFSDVRYLISRRATIETGSYYDIEQSFFEYPCRVLLAPGTLLARLDFPVVHGIFMKFWWLKLNVLDEFVGLAAQRGSNLRTVWQDKQALPKAKGVRTAIFVIQLTAPVYAWEGLAGPKFNRSGGANQIYLPNLARGSGPYRSDYATLYRTYCLPDR